jgi:hypothetical protein
MTDHLFARADEVLTELIELVETARSLPMSTSCVIPRERTLDLLDALRDVLPPELEQARALVAQRDEVLAVAEQAAAQRATTAADEAGRLISAAQTEADELTERARVAQAELVSDTTVHLVAAEQAAELQAQASAALSEAAERAAATRAEAEAEAERLRADSRGYADRTLSELVATLSRLAATAENGRQTLNADSSADLRPGPDS